MKFNVICYFEQAFDKAVARNSARLHSHISHGAQGWLISPNTPTPAPWACRTCVERSVVTITRGIQANHNRNRNFSAKGNRLCGLSITGDMNPFYSVLQNNLQLRVLKKISKSAVSQALV
jgi:hypothetical protein